MTSSARELDQFLAELGARRQRMVKLAQPAGHQLDDLVDELNELSEQLIVADEELRVQQEELERARAALLVLSGERDLLLQNSSKAYVVTDDRGVVTRSTPAAQQLARQPVGRVTPRPIASWFEVSDRRAVRSMIGRVVTTGEPQRVDGVRLRTAEDVELPVSLMVERVSGSGDSEPLLRWELTSAGRPLHAVPERVGSDRDPEASPASALELARSTMAFALCRSREDLFRELLETVVRLVPGAAHAGLVLQRRRVGPESVAGTSDVAQWADEVQLTDRLGPLALALTAFEPVRSDRLAEDVWGVSGRGRGEGWPRCGIALPLLVGDRRLGVLTVYADRPGALAPEAELTATALALHVAVALRRLLESNDLEEAVRARQQVGQAVGILVERYRLTPEVAFSRLVTWSQHENVKLRTIARALVETGQEPSRLSPP